MSRLLYRACSLLRYPFMGASMHTATPSSLPARPSTPQAVMLSTPSGQWAVDVQAMRASPSYPWNAEEVTPDGSNNLINGINSQKVEIPLSRRVDDDDIRVLVQQIHTNHGIEAQSTSSSTMFSLLRASAPRALDFPALHSEVRAAIIGRFQSGPHNLLPRELWSDVEAALALAREYDIIEIQPGLFYTFITTSHFEEDGTSPAQPVTRLLTPKDLALCSTLQNTLLEDFSPTLFQAPPGRHMECTDAIAAAWLAEVVPAAFSGHTGEPGTDTFDLGRPIETLNALQTFNWAVRGVCDVCIKEKHDEWRSEREQIFRRIAKGLSVGSS